MPGYRQGMPGRLVIIGGDAGGMAAVSQVRKQQPDREIVALERGRWTSYSACGIPFFVAGEVADLDQLVARSPEEHRAKARIDLRMRSEATAIDVGNRTVEVFDHEGGRTYELDFDELLIGTGGRPIRPPLPGIELPFVHGVQTLGDADRLMAHAAAIDCKRVVVVGGGYIGLEIAEAFCQRDIEVLLLEAAPQVMSTLDPDMGALVTEAMRRNGVQVHTSTPVTGFDEGMVHAGDGEHPADLVVLGIGVGPESTLAGEAGLDLGAKGAIRVDRRQQTSVEGIWAAGDCAESVHRVSGERVHVALGTVANKQARVAGINIGGGYATFPGVLGTAITRLCDTEIARTGLNEQQAAEAGFLAAPVVVRATTAAHYMPNSGPMTVKLVVERRTARVLGAQIVGAHGSGKRIDTCAAAIWAGLTTGEILDLDLSYAPPFSGVWDPVQVAAREAEKVV
jgi:NADPH-dependent 2,4-dienoyl-CoA reductase/sulfur reductase-like enzyme